MGQPRRRELTEGDDGETASREQRSLTKQGSVMVSGYDFIAAGNHHSLPNGQGLMTK